MQDIVQASLARVFYENEKILHKHVVSMLGDHESASDIVQATFIKVWVYGETRKVAQPKAFIFKTAQNLAKDELRRRSRHRERNIYSDDPDEIGAFHELPSNDKSPEELVLIRQETSAILDAIEKLPLKNRRAFKQHRFYGLSYRQISLNMKVSESSVEKYIIEALQQLRPLYTR